jgi:hypothetical protein
MSDWMKESILGNLKRRYPRLYGAKVADALDILMDSDQFVAEWEEWGSRENFQAEFPNLPRGTISAAFYAAQLYLDPAADIILVDDFVEERLRRLPTPPRPNYTRREVMLIGGNEVERPSFWVSNADGSLGFGVSQVREGGGFETIEARATPHQLLQIASSILDVLRGADEQ